MEHGFIAIISLFIVYFFLIIIFERRILSDPKTIIEKFLAVVMCYVGFSLIYYSMTGKPFLADDDSSYMTYIFLMGFISFFWTIPNLLKEFEFFEKYFGGRKCRHKNHKKK